MANGNNTAIRELRGIERELSALRKQHHKVEVSLMKVHRLQGRLEEKLRYPFQEAKN